MNEAACSWRVITDLILVECLSASMRLAAFSPAPPKAASTPMLSRPLTIAWYTRIGRTSELGAPAPGGSRPPSGDDVQGRVIVLQSGKPIRIKRVAAMSGVPGQSVGL